MNNSIHKSVLLKTIVNKLAFLRDSQDKNYSMIDCTLGTAGHSKALLQTYSNLFILGIDLDQRMIDYVNNNVYNVMNPTVQQRFIIKQNNFINLQKYECRKLFVKKFKTPTFDFIFADFGYNSLHLANANWGFSYLKQGDLDMRYNQKYRKCSQVLANISQYQLIQILKNYGQLNNAHIIAKQLIKFRQKIPLDNTKYIKQAIMQSPNIKNKFKTLIKIFQALRIHTNGQLVDIQTFIQKMPNKLNKDGQAFFITFHSLQQARVIKGLLQHKRNKIIGKIAIQEVTQEQISQNISSRSAKLITCKKLV